MQPNTSFVTFTAAPTASNSGDRSPVPSRMPEHGLPFPRPANSALIRHPVLQRTGPLHPWVAVSHQLPNATVQGVAGFHTLSGSGFAKPAEFPASRVNDRPLVMPVSEPFSRSTNKLAKSAG